MIRYTGEKLIFCTEQTGEKIVWENCKIKTIAGVKPYKRVENINNNKVTIGYYVIIDSHMIIATVIHDAAYPTDAVINTEVIFDIGFIHDIMMYLAVAAEIIPQTKKQEEHLEKLCEVFCELEEEQEDE